MNFTERSSIHTAILNKKKIAVIFPKSDHILSKKKIEHEWYHWTVNED